MNKKWKLAPLAFAIMAYATGFAVTNNACDPACPCPVDPCPPAPCAQECPCPCDPCECCPPPAMCDQGYDIRDCYKAAYNAPARIDVRCSWDFFIQGDFIYWDAREKGLDLGIYGYVADPRTAGEVQNMDFDYKPGFKVGLGLNSEYDDWTVFAQYTFFHNSVSQGLDENRIDTFTTPWMAFIDGPLSGGAKWERDFDILDFEWSRAYYVGKELTFQPFFGTRAYWFKQKYNLHLVVDVQGEDYTYENRSKQRSWAFGARAGIDTRWLLGDGFRIFGNAAVDLLYQRFRTSFTDYEITPDGETPNYTFKDRVGYIVPNLELALGLGWGTYLDNSNYHFDLAAGYEFHYFWNQNMMRRLIDSVNTGLTITTPIDGDAGDLMLHGLTVSARFDF